MSQDGFIIKFFYMDTHLSHALRTVVDQIRTTSHQLEIETGRYTRKFMEEQIDQLCHQDVELKEHYVCYC